MWTLGGVGGDNGEHRELEAAWRRRRKPENEVPASVVIDAVLAESPEVAVFISGARVFSNGVDLTVEIRARHTGTDGRGDMVEASMAMETPAIACSSGSSSPISVDARISAHPFPPTLMPPGPTVRCS